jgi:SAM-dependent methyltransferase
MLQILLKKIFNLIGFDSHAFLFRIFEINAGRICDAKIKMIDEQTRQLVLSEDERFHHKDMILEDLGSQQVVRGFTIDRIQFLHQCEITSEDIVVDIGDSNGIFLRSLNKDGISLNISPDIISSLREKNIETVVADAEHLPFKNESISTILLFQTLEHVPNPILLLNEIARVCKKSLILSIPYVSQTHIHRRKYDLKRPIYEHHIFEFSQNDFRSIVSHTPFKIQKEIIAMVIDKTGISLDRIIVSLWNRIFEPDQFCGCFTKFYLVHLKKEIHLNDTTDKKLTNSLPDKGICFQQ